MSDEQSPRAVLAIEARRNALGDAEVEAITAILSRGLLEGGGESRPR